MLTAGQMRAARGLLGWSQNDLAQAAGVGLSTVKRMEASEGIVRANAENAWKVRKAIQSAGIELIDEDGGGAGARWSRKQS